MQRRPFGRSGFDVSALCLGGNVFGWTSDEPTTFAVLDAFVEAGGDFVDTADSYSRWVPGHHGGESETLLGRWCRARGNRKRVVIATKVGSAMGDAPDQKGLSRRRIMQGAEDSLRRLQTDFIDLYQAHVDDQAVPLEETLRAFDDLVRQGKVRAIGASNYKADRLNEALAVSERAGLAAYVSLQPRYNLVDRADYEHDAEPLCLAHGLAVIPYSSLASGFLSGKYRPGAPLPATPRAGGIAPRYLNERGFRVLEAVDAVADEHNATPAQIALAWLLARPSITAPIASATSVEQLRELAGATDIQLSPDAVARLDAASAAG